jgi:hypothetical protein
VQIFGDDAKVLDELARRWPLVEAVPGVVDVVGPQAGNPEVEWRVDPLAAAARPDRVRRCQPGQRRLVGVSAPDLRMLDRTVPTGAPDSVRRDTATLGETRVRAAPDSSSRSPASPAGRQQRAEHGAAREPAVDVAGDGAARRARPGSAVTDLRERLRK